LPNVVVDGWLGSVIVESSAPIVGATTMHWLLYSAAYSAITTGGTKMYLPSGTRRRPNTDPVTGNPIWLQYTSVLVQNLNPVLDGTVRLHWYDRLGHELYVFTDTISANASHGYNTRFTESNVPDHAALHQALTDDWNGSIVIESLTPGVDIVAIANLQWTEDHPTHAAASAYASAPQGQSELFVPATFRRLQGGNWLQYTGLIVQNVGNSTCNNFTISWRDRTGQELLTFTDTLSPNIAHGYNTRFGATGSDVPGTAVIPNLTDDFRGSVHIIAPGCELLGIHNTVWPAFTDSTTYNLFGR